MDKKINKYSETITQDDTLPAAQAMLYAWMKTTLKKVRLA